MGATQQTGEGCKIPMTKKSPSVSNPLVSTTTSSELTKIDIVIRHALLPPPPPPLPPPPPPPPPPSPFPPLPSPFSPLPPLSPLSLPLPPVLLYSFLFFPLRFTLPRRYTPLPL